MGTDAVLHERASCCKQICLYRSQLEIAVAALFIASTRLLESYCQARNDFVSQGLCAVQVMLQLLVDLEYRGVHSNTRRFCIGPCSRQGGARLGNLALIAIEERKRNP